MKKRMIAMALVIVMIFALGACGKKQEAAPAATEAPAPAATEAPAPATEAPAPATEAPAAPATEAPKEEPKGIPDGSGVVTITSKAKNFSIDFDSDAAVANELGTGSIIINAGTDEGIPYCTVSILEPDAADDAASYLKDLAAGAEEELGKDIATKADEPKKALESRDIYYIYYTYKDMDAGGTVCCAYYAENLDNGDIVVFNSLALEQDAETVNAILKLAIESFKLAV